jgi:hypothetical protein
MGSPCRASERCINSTVFQRMRGSIQCSIKRQIPTFLQTKIKKKQTKQLF